MSDKGARLRERRRSYLKQLRGEKKGVSPVVATLILILIAVAAAAALYLWLVAWQGGVTGSIGSPGAQYTLSIGGSTSVYPFAEIAAAQFEANNTDVAVSVNQGGSGAGMAAVCSNQINIGEASAFYSASQLETSYGCPVTLNEQIIAYDGVDAIVPTGNVHGLQSIQWDTLSAIYVSASTTAPTSGITYVQGSYHMDGALAGTQPAQGTSYLWDEIPAFASADIGNTYSTVLFTNVGYTSTVGGALGAAEAACATAPYTSDLCDATAQATSCGFSICAGGTGAGAAAGEFQAPIQTAYRSDVSGTQQSFLSRLIGAGSQTATSPTGIGFSGCSGDNQWDGCGMTLSSANDHGEDGNPAVISYVAGAPDSIGFASDGLVQASGSGVIPINFQGIGQTAVITITGESTALKAIALGIEYTRSGSSSYTTAGYVGWRPFMNVETAPPTGEALRYLEFVMDPANNENIATEANEISVYASGLAGVVPITPVTGYQETL